jgi:hypothetical protein
MTIDELVAVFRRHLYLPDPGPLLIVVAAVVANRLAGDPVWLFLVGPSSIGKTEILSALGGLDDVYPVSTITEAGLLSGSTSKRQDATGGLLAEMTERGGQGIIVCKDFTSILSKPPQSRAELLAALREVYDGAWVRRLGVNGGTTRAWQGKAGLIGGVTETIERHAAVIGAMGERMALYRMPVLDDDARLAHGLVGARHSGREASFRAELVEAVTEFMAGLTLPQEPEPIDDAGTEALVRLADLATRCRSVVERDERTKEVVLAPQSEAATRLLSVLMALTRALWAIGVPDEEVQRLIVNVALDAMTKARRAVVDLMARARPGTLWSAAQVADAVGLPTSAVAHTLEDLAAHGVVERHSDANSPHRWGPSAWLTTRWGELDLPTGRADDNRHDKEANP